MKSTFSSLGEESPIGNGWIFSNGVFCIEWEDEDVAQNLRTQKKFFLLSVVAERKDVQKVQTADVARTHCMWSSLPL